MSRISHCSVFKDYPLIICYWGPKCRTSPVSELLPPSPQRQSSALDGDYSAETEDVQIKSAFDSLSVTHLHIPRRNETKRDLKPVRANERKPLALVFMPEGQLPCPLVRSSSQLDTVPTDLHCRPAPTAACLPHTHLAPRERHCWSDFHIKALIWPRKDRAGS